MAYEYKEFTINISINRNPLTIYITAQNEGPAIDYVRKHLREINGDVVPDKNSKCPLTNVEFVKDLMEFSNYGALAQMFVMDALAKWSDRVSKADLAQFGSASIVSPEAWIGVAKEIKAKIDDRHK